MQPTEIEVVVTDGQITDDLKERARTKIANLEKYSPGDFLHAEVRFARPHTSQGPGEAVVTQALLDVQGRLVQARMKADHAEEALDLLEKRLQKKLRRLNERLQSRRHEPETVEEGEWRRGALPTDRPDHFPRPRDEREVIERMTYARAAATPDEAAFDLELLENDWLLYEDAGSGRDALIHRFPDGRTYGLSIAADEPPEPGEYAYTIHLEPPPSQLDLDEALRRLDDGDEGFVFFVDREAGRGAVVYRRYDGHYGVVRPREAA